MAQDRTWDIDIFCLQWLFQFSQPQLFLMAFWSKNVDLKQCMCPFYHRAGKPFCLNRGKQQHWMTPKRQTVCLLKQTEGRSESRLCPVMRWGRKTFKFWRWWCFLIIKQTDVFPVLVPHHTLSPTQTIRGTNVPHHRKTFTACSCSGQTERKTSWREKDQYCHCKQILIWRVKDELGTQTDGLCVKQKQHHPGWSEHQVISHWCVKNVCKAAGKTVCF